VTQSSADRDHHRRRDGHTPERVLVTREVASPLVAVRELAEHTAVGDSYLGSLLRAQLKTSLFTACSLGLFLIVTPAAFALVGTTRTTKLFGITLPWLVLGVVVYPFLIGLAHRFIKRAEANEDGFEELVRPGSNVDPLPRRGQ
jgi:hypothetical protein